MNTYKATTVFKHITSNTKNKKVSLKTKNFHNSIFFQKQLFWLIRSENGFQHFNITNLSYFLIKLAIFFKLYNIYYHFFGFSSPWARKPPMGFDNRLLKKFDWHWKNAFQSSNITYSSNFFYKTCNFCNFFLIFVIYCVSPASLPKNILWGLIISYCNVSGGNELYFNFLMSQILAIFLKKFYKKLNDPNYPKNKFMQKNWFLSGFPVHFSTT